MRQMKRKACTAFLLVILLTVMNGCGEKEQIRVIELPPLELEVMDAEKLRINSIQEYAGIGREDQRLHLAWGENADLLCLMKVEGGSYLYQTIDTKSNTVVSSVCVDERAADMSNIAVAPGGRYVSYEIENGGVVWS